MNSEPKKGTLEENPPVFKTWKSWYWAVIAGNIVFGLWMVLYFSKFN